MVFKDKKKKTESLEFKCILINVFIIGLDRWEYIQLKYIKYKN